MPDSEIQNLITERREIEQRDVVPGMRLLAAGMLRLCRGLAEIHQREMWRPDYPSFREYLTGEVGITLSYSHTMRWLQCWRDLISPYIQLFLEDGDLRHVPNASPLLELLPYADHERVPDLIQMNLDGCDSQGWQAAKLELLKGETPERASEAAQERGKRIAENIRSERVSALSKPFVWESEGYKAYVRALCCCRCGADPPSDPHHLDRNPKVSGDIWLLPLCRKHHNEEQKKEPTLEDRLLSGRMLAGYVAGLENLGRKQF